MTTHNLQATRRTLVRYQRIAPFYDHMEALAEPRYRAWRERLWSLVRGPKVLEVGVGTGKNMPFYPANFEILAIDLTPGMLERARERARILAIPNLELRQGDVQELEFPDAAFDAVVATFVFCSVPDPVLGLRELRRVARPNGQLVLLEHVRSPNPIVGTAMDAANPIIVRMMGANINRRTVDNVVAAGWQLETVVDLGAGGIFKLIQGSNAS